MKPFLAGGKNRTKNNNENSDPLRRLQEIQMKREQAEKRPVRFEDEQGLDEGDEVGRRQDEGRARAVPRNGRLRAIRFGPRRRYAALAEPLED